MRITYIEEEINMKLLKCSVCGNIVEMVEDKGIPVMCCGKPMNVLEANTTDGAL